MVGRSTRQLVGLLMVGCMAAGMAAYAQASRPVKIVLVGDSTVALEGGWGPGFCKVMKPEVECVDLALNGRSSKSFIDEGAWAKALEERGKYYLIQFGHNDQKPDPSRHTDANTTFVATLRGYIRDVRGIGGVPVVVTPLSRRTYKDGKVVQDLNDYAAGARRAAKEEHANVIDLNALSSKLLEPMTQAQADGFDAAVHPDAKAEAVAATGGAASAAPAFDRTHLNAKGQAVFGRMVADQLVMARKELREHLMAPPLDASMAGAGKKVPLEWRFEKTESVGGHATQVLGHPEVIETPMGKAVHFNGVDDALFVKVHPLAGAAQWTWEMIFRPDADGNAAQRVFHLQSVDPVTGEDILDERMLFEIRIVKGQWCLDSFAIAGGQSRALLNCEKLHPLGPWYRVTTVYDGVTLKNYVGDELQGEGPLAIPAERPGRSSVGVRINLVDPFKGAIYAARFTRSALGVGDFMKIPAGK